MDKKSQVYRLAEKVKAAIPHAKADYSDTTNSAYFEGAFETGLGLRVSDHLGRTEKNLVQIILNSDGSASAIYGLHIHTLDRKDALTFITAFAFAQWTESAKTSSKIIDGLQARVARLQSELDRSPLKGLTPAQVKDVTDYVAKKFRKAETAKP